MPQERELYFPEIAEIGWLQYLGDFEEQVYPLFKKLGYSKGEALQVWWLNKVFNKLDAIYEDGIPVADDNDGNEDYGRSKP